MLVDAPGPRLVGGQDRLPRTRGDGPRLSLVGLGSQRSMTAMFASSCRSPAGSVRRFSRSIRSALSSTQSGRFTSGHGGDSYRDALLVPDPMGHALGRR